MIFCLFFLIRVGLQAQFLESRNHKNWRNQKLGKAKLPGYATGQKSSLLDIPDDPPFKVFIYKFNLGPAYADWQ